MKKTVLLGCGVPLIVVGLLTILGARALFKPEAVSERSETVGRGDVEIKVVETGTIEPLRKVEVKSKVGGRIAKMLVEEGAVVRQGQILATIDPQEINSQVAALRAQMAGAQARLAASRKGVTYQRAQTGTSIAQYEQNLIAATTRQRQAEEDTKVQPELTRQSIDMAQASLEAAQSMLKAQQDTLNLLLQSTHPQAIVAAQSAYDQARAQADNAARNAQRQRQLLAKGFVAQSIVDTAEADRSVAEAHLREVKERLDRIQKTNEIEEANARSQVASAASQVRQQAAALAQAKSSILPATRQRDLESARAAAAQARAQLEAARSGRTQDLVRVDDATAAAAEVQQIKNQLDQLLVQQGDTTLVAPMSGVITKRYVEPGELITSALATFSSGTAVYQIADLATMLVKINVNEVDIAKIKKGLLAEVTIDAVKGAAFVGHVRKVSPASQSGASGSSGDSGGSQGVVRFPVEVQIDHADARLRPGMSARCALIVSRRKEVVRLPTNSVAGIGAKGTVQIVTMTEQNGRKRQQTTPRPVTIGLRGDDFVEIVSGVKVGEKVRPNPYNGPPRKAVDIFHEGNGDGGM